jgi:DNA topoisomerase-2
LFYIREAKDPETRVEINEKTLGLSLSISTNNMYMYGVDGKIKKYNTVSEILEEFCVFRLKQYDLRKEKTCENYRHNMNIYTNKIRFVNEIQDGSIVLKDYNSTDLVRLLSKKNYPRISDSYDYLTGMTILQQTSNSLQKMKNELETLSREYDSYKIQSGRDIWKEELRTLRKEYTYYDTVIHTTNQM